MQNRSYATSWSVGLVVLVGIAAVLFSCVLPYGLEHWKRIEAAQLASILSIWRKQGAVEESLGQFTATNSRVQVFVLKRRLTYNGRICDGIIALDSSSFRGNGILVGSPEGDVYWLDRNGKVQLIREQSREDNSKSSKR